MKVYQRVSQWWADFKYVDADGREHRWRKSLKLAGTVSKRDARKAADDVRASLHAASLLEELGVALPISRSDRVACPFSGLAKNWLDEIRVDARKATTPYRYGITIRLYLVNGPAGLGDKDVADITPADVKALRNDLASRFAPSVTNQALHVLRSILEHGVRARYVTENVARQIKCVPKNAGGHTDAWDWYTPDEAARFLAAAYETSPFGTLMLTGLQTGLRPGELLALRWSDLTLHGDAIGVQVSSTVTKVDGEWQIGPP